MQVSEILFGCFWSELISVFFFVNSVATSVEINGTTYPAVERKNITLFCQASGKPEPTVTWTRVGSSDILSNTSVLTLVNVSRPGTPDNMIQYQCTASNGVGNPATAVANLNVTCKSTFHLFRVHRKSCEIYSDIFTGHVSTWQVNKVKVPFNFFKN